MGWRAIAVLVFLGFVSVIFAWAVISLVFAPTGNTNAARFDTLIVLGAPADPDGNPMPVMLSRVDEAVREYERGIAPRMILSGGLDGGRYAQAAIMARAVAAQGVPASAIFVEANSNDTIHNACYSARIMKDHGWRSAEIITSPTHMRRAGIIFSHSTINWHMHAAAPIQAQTATDRNFARTLEVFKAVRYLLYGDWAEPCSP
jgi:uncharacterized SAM-binding protein YcdF (DUF218 family)